MTFRLLFLLLFVSSCAPNEPLDQRFMAECDCYVYQKEIMKLPRGGYTIELINKSIASECVLNQLRNTSIVQFKDSLGIESIVLKTKSPEKFINSLQKWAIKYGSKNTRIKHMIVRSKSLQLILGKLYDNPRDSLFHNTFRPYKVIHMKRTHSDWIEDHTNINSYWPWKNPKSW